MSAPRLAWPACLKKTGEKLELLPNIDILLMVEKGTRGGICNAIHRYAKANNKYMNNYDRDIESSYLEYLDATNLCGLAMSQKLPVNGFEWVEELSKLKEGLIKFFYEDSNKGCFLEVDVGYPNIHKLHSDLPFLPERSRIKNFNKLVCSVCDKKNIHIKALKQVLNHGLIFKNVNGIIQFTQEAWLKSYTDMNSNLRKEAKNDFEKDFCQLMNNAVFGKTMEPVRKH